LKGDDNRKSRKKPRPEGDWARKGTPKNLLGSGNRREEKSELSSIIPGTSSKGVPANEGIEYGALKESEESKIHRVLQ